MLTLKGEKDWDIGGAHGGFKSSGTALIHKLGGGFVRV